MTGLRKAGLGHTQGTGLASASHPASGPRATSEHLPGTLLRGAHRPGSSRGDGPGHVHRGSSGVGLGPPAAPGAISAPRCSAAARRGVGGGQRSLSDSACATPRPSATSHRLTEHCHGKAERKDRAVKPFHAQLSARRGAAAHAPTARTRAHGPRTRPRPPHTWPRVLRGVTLGRERGTRLACALTGGRATKTRSTRATEDDPAIDGTDLRHVPRPGRTLTA